MIHGVAGLWAQSFRLCIHHSLSPSPTHTLCPVHGRIPSASHAQSFSLCIQSVTHSNTLSCRRGHISSPSHTQCFSLCIHQSVSQSVSQSHTHTHTHTLSCPWTHPFTKSYTMHPVVSASISQSTTCTLCPVHGHIPLLITHNPSICIHHSLTHCPVLLVDTSLC